jgi:hypothetical protein
VHRDIPRLLALYRAWKLKLDALVTRTYKLDEIKLSLCGDESGGECSGSDLVLIDFDAPPSGTPPLLRIGAHRCLAEEPQRMPSSNRNEAR